MVQGELLEGPLYDEHHQKCRFIDIEDKKLYTFSTSEGPKSLKVITTPETLGYVPGRTSRTTTKYTATDKCLSVIAAIKGRVDDLIVAARNGFATLNTITGELKYVKHVVDGLSDGPDRGHR